MGLCRAGIPIRTCQSEVQNGAPKGALEFHDVRIARRARVRRLHAGEASRFLRLPGGGRPWRMSNRSAGAR